MSTLNPMDSSGVSRALHEEAAYLADVYATIVRYHIDLQTQLADNGASLGLSTAQQAEVADWKNNIIGAIRNAFEGAPITTVESMIAKISAQRPLGK